MSSLDIDKQNNMDFLTAHDQNPAFMAHFPNWNSMSEQDQEEARRAWIRKDRVALVQHFGFDSDNSNGDSNSRLSPQ